MSNKKTTDTNMSIKLYYDQIKVQEILNQSTNSAQQLAKKLGNKHEINN